MNDSMQALGWTLVHFCWQAAVIALLYRVVDLIFARSRSNVRYALALGAMISMFLVALGTLGYEGIRMERNSTLLIAPSHVTSFHDHYAHSVAATITPPTANLSATDKKIGAHDLAARFVSKMPLSLARWIPWIDAMWLAGVLILSLRTIGGWMLIRRLRISALMEIPESVRIAFDRLSHRMGIGRRIDLFICERISGPLAMGVFRSVILLPVSALTHLSPDQLEVVLAHELAHIRRGDYLWNMIQTMVETLFFFHPAVWWLGGQLRQQRELCCDDVALSCCADPVVYATALLRLEEQRRPRMQLAMALDGHAAGSSLKARIIRILDGAPGDVPERRRELTPLSLVGVSAMVGLFLLPLPHVFADHAKPPQLLAAAVIYPAPRSHVSTEVKCAPKSAFTVAQAPVAPVPPRATLAVAPAHKSGLVIAPALAANVAVAISPAVAAPAIAVAPVVTPAVPASPNVVLNISASVAQIRNVMPRMTLSNAMVLQAPGVGQSKSDYISDMRAAGYDVDLDQLVKMKIQGVTPEYAKSMAQLGYGKPTADELVSLKIFDVKPETVTQLKTAGMTPTNFRDLISYQIFKVTPEFVAGMKAAGFDSIPPAKLKALRVQNVTPEFAKAARQQYPDITLDQLIKLKIFNIDQAFIASAKSHGFNQLTVDKLVKLRISGLLDEGNQKSEDK